MPECGLDWKPKDNLLNFEEIERLAQLFASHGINKIRLTGGEPTLRHGLETLISRLAKISGIDSVGLTTNGVKLAKLAPIYKAHGLNNLNISLDTLQPLKYERMTRRSQFTHVMHGLEAALEAGFESLKLNVVVMRGLNDDEITQFVDFVADKPLNVRFIEFMPFMANGWDSHTLVPYHEMKQVIQQQYPLIPILNEASAVAKDFAIEGFQGTVSFITSMTESFCATCNRIRLTAEGGLKPCLHDAAEINLRDALRANVSDSTLLQLIQSALNLKKPEHLPMEALSHTTQLYMTQIGG